MTVLIDPPRWPAHGRLWSHLASDTSFDELHTFAAVAGVPARGFEGDHYDVPEERYDDLVAAGATPVGTRVLLAGLLASGLRRRKRRGERVVLSVPDRTGAGRLDVVTSPLQPPGAITRVHLAWNRNRSRRLEVYGRSSWDVTPQHRAGVGEPREDDLLPAMLALPWPQRALLELPHLRRVGFLRRVPAAAAALPTHETVWLVDATLVPTTAIDPYLDVTAGRSGQSMPGEVDWWSALISSIR